jgi:DNA-binding ferritin-like protein
MNNKLIQNLLTILNQLKYYHWGTNSFAQHKALGEAYDKLNILIDDFVEILLGKYGKELSPISINIRTESELNLNDALNEISQYLVNELPSFLDDSDTDLLNLRDEFLSIINKTKYLLKLT